MPAIRSIKTRRIADDEGLRCGRDTAMLRAKRLQGDSDGTPKRGMLTLLSVFLFEPGAAGGLPTRR